MTGSAIGLGISLLSVTIWLGLLLFRGQFWRCDQVLEEAQSQDSTLPSVCAIIPARNEAELLPTTLRSLLTQSYRGSFQVILVDDHSTDDTAETARAIAQELDQSDRLFVIAAKPLPPNWTGKLWAMDQGIKAAVAMVPEPEYLLLTDADIQHNSNNLATLVAKAQQDNLDLTSLMVLLRCKSFWEQLLIPAFVFFFQKLYPFRWVNTPTHPMAAAAGGCSLIRRQALDRIGGLERVRQALIDDCALAQAVKLGTHAPLKPGANIWLGLTQKTFSLRPYPSLETIWSMVARTAFTQLNYSPFLLVGTLIGMTLIYLVPPIALVFGLVIGNWAIALAGLAGWLLMTLAYVPTIRFYQCPAIFAFCLPAIAFLYTVMTLDSALQHWQGRGGAWKGRVYSN